jgi:hypothetical protein
MGRSRFSAAGALLLAAAMGVARAQTPPPALGVGDGAPTSALEFAFVQAFDCGSFATSVIVPPIDKVHAVGSGYIQDFNDSNPSEGFSFALAAPNSVPGAVYQMCCQILALHTSIGSFTGKVGYPITDFMNGLVSPVDGGRILKAATFCSRTKPARERGRRFSCSRRFRRRGRRRRPPGRRSASSSAPPPSSGPPARSRIFRAA